MGLFSKHLQYDEQKYFHEIPNSICHGINQIMIGEICLKIQKILERIQPTVPIIIENKR